MLTALPAYFPTCEGAYLVGGCVRDLLLGRPPADYDVAVLGDSRAYAQTLAAAAGGRIVEIGKAGIPPVAGGRPGRHHRRHRRRRS